MIVGFTGTQVGMSDRQIQRVYDLLISLNATELHHGDCIGADAGAHVIARALGLKIVIHPPSNPSKRAMCHRDLGEDGRLAELTLILPAKEYIARNHDIVDASEFLIAAPKSLQEELRSGTWATVRYARKLDRPLEIIGPD